MLIEEQIEIRKKRAEDEKFKIQKIGAEKVFTDYKIESSSGNKTYRVAIRGFGTGDNYCSCPDYASNTLGTCKHVEAVLNQIQKRIPKKYITYKEDKRCEVYLEYGKCLNVKIRLPAKASKELKTIKNRYFDENNILQKERFPKFTSLMKDADKLDSNITIYSDAIEFVERQLELKHNLKKEQEILQKISDGKLKLNFVKANLYPYQMQGIFFAALRGRTIIGDDMGLGKTVQAIAAAEILSRRKGITKVLIIAPASLKYQWQHEIRKFVGKDSLVMEGLKNKRMILYEKDFFYKITNYEAVIRDIDLITNWNPELIILDEAQRIKNWETKTAKAIKSLRSKYAIVLTGTPMENKLGELYSIVQFIDNRQLGPAFQFFKEHVQFDDSGRLLGYKDLNKVREMLKPIFIRRHKHEVLKQLPPKTENVYYVKMSNEQAVPYDEQSAVVAQILAKWKRQKWLSEIDRRRLLCCIVNMRMLCDSTYLFDKKTNFSPKLEEFEKLIEEICIDNGKKVVVFSQWTRMLIKASEVLDKMKVKNVLFHGGVHVKKRGKLIEEFREDEKCKVFLSTDAGGLGLNLQSADTVINLDIPWNPAVIEQRIGRVHRLGQYNKVTAINLVTRGSIEERVLATVQLKKQLFKGLFEGTANDVDFSALQKQSFVNVVNEIMEDEIKKREEKSLVEKEYLESPADKFINAGIDFLNAIANSLNASQEGSNGGPAKDPKENVTESIRQGIFKMIKTDKDTGKPVLTIPLPSEEVIKKGVDALSNIFKSFER